MIIKYSDDVIEENNGHWWEESAFRFTKDYNTASGKLDDYPNGGTNIDAGLTEALKYIDDENTSVILMSDGISSWYIDERGNKQGTTNPNGIYNRAAERASNEAIETANTIKNERHAKIYSIGFGLDEITNRDNYNGKSSREHAKDVMKSIASPTEQLSDGNTKEYYFESSNGSDLVDAFDDIFNYVTSENESLPIELSTSDGIIEISEGIEEGQNIQIYTGEYIKGESNPYVQYSWDEFENLTYTETDEEGNEKETKLVEYVRDSDGNITSIRFNLGKYMEREGMLKSENLTIRFSKQATVVSRARTLSLIIDAVENEEINQETVSTYEDKFNEAEANKAEATKPADTTTENVETITPDTDKETEVVEDDKENVTEGTESGTTEGEGNTTTEEKPAEQPTESETTTGTENVEQDTTSNINEQNAE